jgi:hypothetical protein
MRLVLLLWSALAFVPMALAAVLALVGSRRLVTLARVPRFEGPAFPRVSVIVAARDEARGVERAARSLLALDWPDLEVVAVDDRSTDGTGAILDRLASLDPRLAVVHVTELPDGWLGKNHALHLAASRASGSWLLFTDGDVVLHPAALRHAVAYADSHRLDHLTVGPEAPVPGLPLQAAVAGFGVFFGLAIQPWRVRNPRTRAHVGIGAFNLVRAEAYRRAGGHTALALRPDDDLMLGKRLKRTGARQDLAFGRGLVQVPWYHSLGEMAHGLEKNAFAAVGYSVTLALASAAGGVLLFALPPFLALVAEGAARAMFAGAALLHVAAAAESARRTGLPRRVALLFPFAAAFMSYVVLRSMAVTLRQGGIRWRGTLYPLAALRANRL